MNKKFNVHVIGICFVVSCLFLTPVSAREKKTQKDAWTVNESGITTFESKFNKLIEGMSIKNARKLFTASDMKLCNVQKFGGKEDVLWQWWFPLSHSSSGNNTFIVQFKFKKVYRIWVKNIDYQESLQQ